MLNIDLAATANPKGEMKAVWQIFQRNFNRFTFKINLYLPRINVLRGVK